MKKYVVSVLIAFVALNSWAQEKLANFEINGNVGAYAPSGGNSELFGTDAKIFAPVSERGDNMFSIGLRLNYDRMASSAIYDTAAILKQRACAALDLRWFHTTQKSGSIGFNRIFDIYAGYAYNDKNAGVSYLDSNSNLSSRYERSKQTDAVNFGASLVFFKNNRIALSLGEGLINAVTLSFNAYWSPGIRSGVVTKTTYVNNVATVDTIYPAGFQGDDVANISTTTSLGVDLCPIPTMSRKIGFSVPLKVSYATNTDLKFQSGILCSFGIGLDDYVHYGKIISISGTYNPTYGGIGWMGTISVTRLIDLFSND